MNMKISAQISTVQKSTFLANVNVTHVHVRYMSSSVHLSSVTFVHPTQAIEIFGNISTPFGTLATL